MATKVAGSAESNQTQAEVHNARKRALLPIESLRRIRSVVAGSKRLGFLSNEYWAEENLMRALSKMERGEDVDFRGKTPYSETPRHEVVSQWSPILQKTVEASTKLVVDERRELLILEQDQADNISVQSKYKPFSVDGLEKLRKYFNIRPSIPKDRAAFEKACDWCIRLVPRHSLRSLSAQEVWDNTTSEGKVSPMSDTMDSNTHSGAPHFQHGWKVSPAMTEEMSKRVGVVERWLRPAAEEYYARIDNGEPIPNVTILFQRLAQKKDPEKIKRLVWAVWKPAVLAEKRFVPALQNVFREIKFKGGVPVGIGLTDPLNSDLACQVMISQAAENKRTVLGLDYSAFDASQSSWLNEQIYRIWAEWFPNGEWLCKFAKQMYNNHYIITPTGLYHPDTIGGPSGLTDTLIRNSFISLLVTMYGYYAGYWDEPNNAIYLGDDGDIDAAGLTAEKYSACAGEFGLVMNADKVFNVPGQMHWLQRLHCQGLLGGMMPTMRMLGSLMSHERSVDIGKNGVLEIVRTYGSVENCVFHPSFEEFVEFVAKGDRKHLGRDMDMRGAIASSSDEDLESRNLLWRGTKDESLENYNKMAVRWVLKGGSLPPVGSYARFLKAYGEERLQTNVHPALANELAYWRDKG